MEAIRAAGLKLAVDPLGGAAVHYWEPINADLQARHRRRQSEGRSDLLVHDRRSRRQDPHGLLQPLRDGEAGRAQGSLPGRLRQRSRFRSARHRHAVGRADEPEPLSGGGDPIFAGASAALAGAGGDRQDGGQQQHDRPGRATSSAAALSEVPVGFKWFVPGLFDGSCCFGGEESAGASFLRRDGTRVDDRQGRPDHGSAGGRDHRPHRQGPGRALPRADGGVRDGVLHAHRRAGDARSRKRSWKGLSPEAVKEPELAGEPILREADASAGKRRADRRSQGRRRAAAGSRRGRRAPRPSTRSTRKASRTRPTSTPSSSEAQAMVNNALGSSDLTPGAKRNDMNDDRSSGTAFHHFHRRYRASGVLLHVSSLPSPYGIGDVGPAALAWVDRLHEAGQGWWQALPLGPTGYGNSPYQSLSSFAGNELLISPDGLIEDRSASGQATAKARSFSAASVDYDARHPVQEPSCSKRPGTNSTPVRVPDLRADFEQFCQRQAALARRLRSVPER